jgi:tRNA modification GTPase
MGPLVADRERRSDVIVAPATPPGVSALAVVRLSGPAGAALAVARKLAPSLPAAPEPRRARLCRLVDDGGNALDDALVLHFPAPASATGEEVVELFCHGSPAIVAALLDAARRAGARPAARGEFTRRALENGKLDLAEAEGVARLSAAESRGAARRALGLVDGDLSCRVRALREELLGELAELEAKLDFAEDMDPGDDGKTKGALDRIAAELARLGALASASAARERRPCVAILGRPNAGKSTLFNALVGSDRAIVTPVPGTTRDAISESCEIAGERVRLLDTAGLRATTDTVERIGVAVAENAGQTADVVVYTIDMADAATEEDREFLRKGREGPVLVVGTKADLVSVRASAGPASFVADVVVSAVTGEGLDALRAAITSRLGLAEGGEEILVLDRHREALSTAEVAIREGLGLFRAREDPAVELVAAALRRALTALGEITGETTTDELLEKIFATFCIGK